jgi:hypothetical protein
MNVTIAGSLTSMFDFGPGGGHTPVLFLDPTTGQPTLTAVTTQH